MGGQSVARTMERDDSKFLAKKKLEVHPLFKKLLKAEKNMMRTQSKQEH